MRLSVFAEFSRPDIIDQFKIKFSYIDVDFPANSTYPSNVNCSAESIEILKHNAKLFYEKKDLDIVAEVSNYLLSIGFDMIDSNPYTIIKEKYKYKNEITGKEEYKVRKIYSNDRIIFNYSEKIF